MEFIHFIPDLDDDQLTQSRQVLIAQLQPNGNRTLVALHNVNGVYAEWLQRRNRQSTVALRVFLNDSRCYPLQTDRVADRALR